MKGGLAGSHIFSTDGADDADNSRPVGLRFFSTDGADDADNSGLAGSHIFSADDR